MRMTARLAGAALLAIAAGHAQAQGNPTDQTKQTAAQAETPKTPQAADLQGYVLMLQEEEGRLKAARDEADRGPAQSQPGAMSQQRMDLMQTLRNAWHTVQKVPAEFADNTAYKDAERHLRERFGDVGPTRRLEKAEGVAAADDALQTIAGLRQQVAQAAQQAGGAIPTPPVQGGGTAR